MEKKSCGCAVRTKEKFNAGLTKDAKAIVAGVEGYGKEEKAKKAAEVKAAFPPTKAGAGAGKGAAVTKAKVATKTAAKVSAKKSPTPAGMSKGAHGGDVC